MWSSSAVSFFWGAWGGANEDGDGDSGVRSGFSTGHRSCVCTPVPLVSILSSSMDLMLAVTRGKRDQPWGAALGWDPEAGVPVLPQLGCVISRGQSAFPDLFPGSETHRFVVSS